MAERQDYMKDQIIRIYEHLSGDYLEDGNNAQLRCLFTVTRQQDLSMCLSSFDVF